jgi:hypothetical protein
MSRASPSENEAASGAHSRGQSTSTVREKVLCQTENVKRMADCYRKLADIFGKLTHRILTDPGAAKFLLAASERWLAAGEWLHELLERRER